MEITKLISAIHASRAEHQYNAKRALLRAAITEAFDSLSSAQQSEVNQRAQEVLQADAKYKGAPTFKGALSSLGVEVMEAMLVALYRNGINDFPFKSVMSCWNSSPKGIPDGQKAKYVQMVESTLASAPFVSAQQTQQTQDTQERFTVTIPTLKLDQANPQMVAAINAMLGNTLPAYEGEALTIERIEAIIQSQSREAQEAAHQVAKLTRDLQNAKNAAPAVIQSTVAGIPNGKTRAYNAADLFLHPQTKAKHPKLNFEVPGYEWDGDHPYVPAIDPDYEFDISHLIAVLSALLLNQNVWAWGHTGTGKTTLIEQVCARLRWPVTRFNLDSGIERTDLIGQTVLEESNGTTISSFKPGPLVEAMKAGHVILLDEMDFVRPDTAYALQRALESKGLLLTENGGELVQPHPMTRFVATANTRGQGDESGLYQGARVQSTALLNRFAKWIRVGYITTDSEQRLIGSKFPELAAKFHKQIASFAAEMRTAFTKEQTTLAFSPRNSMALAQTLAFYTSIMDEATAVESAIQHTIMEACSQTDANVVGEIRLRCFG